MKCKKHSCDLSSTIGVCASCLRQRLHFLIAAQSEMGHGSSPNDMNAYSESNSHSHSATPTRVFPRSVSPYVARRASRRDTTVRHHQHRCVSSTPPSGPGLKTSTAASTLDDFISRSCTKKAKPKRFSLLSSLLLFRSRSDKFDPDRKRTEDYSHSSLHSRYSIGAPTTSSSSSPYRLSAIFSSPRRKKGCFAEAAGGGGRPRRTVMNRGMSPVRDADSDCEITSEESGKSFPAAEAAAVAATRRGRKSAAAAGMAFCLSPLVRASPNRHWKRNGGVALPPDTRIAGEIRVPAKPHLSTAASYCGNRSRKLADFGKVNYNR